MPKSMPVVCISGTAPSQVQEELAAALMEREVCEFATTSQAKLHKEVTYITVDSPGFPSCYGANGFSEIMNYNIRYVWAPAWGSTVDEFIDVVLFFKKWYRSGASFVSTRGGTTPVSFLTAVKEGLGSDGGLFMLQEMPKMPRSQLLHYCETKSLTYIEGAQIIIEQLVDATMHPKQLHDFMTLAYNKERWSNKENICPVRPLLERQQRAGEKWTRHVGLLELYHGPTAAFKDFALQLFPHYFNLSVTKQDINSCAPPPPLSARQHGKESEGNATGSGSYNYFQQQQVAAKLRRNRDNYLILAATSGDTGVAAISGFQNIDSPAIRVAVLYPLNGVSPVQQLQMLSMDDGHRVRVHGVKADFDYCQSTVKDIFSNLEVKDTLAALKPHSTFLSSANSINWGRLIPQVAYYFWCYRQLVRVAKERQGSLEASHNVMYPNRPSMSLSQQSLTPPAGYSSGDISPMGPLLETLVPAGFVFGSVIDIVVPCGNFGNILAAFMAKLMGLPIRTLVVASNENDVLFEFIQTGKYTISARNLSTTASPSIDILVASNVERFLFLLSGGDAAFVGAMMHQLKTNKSFTLPDHLRELMQKTFWAGRCSEQLCGKTIQDVYEKSRGARLLDTHTAVAVAVAQMYREEMFAREAREAEEAEEDAEENGRSSGGKGSRRRTHRSPQTGPSQTTSLEVPLIIASTAHWSKFPDAVYRALRGRSMTKKFDPYGDRMSKLNASAGSSGSSMGSRPQSASGAGFPFNPSLSMEELIRVRLPKPEGVNIPEVVSHTLTRYREIGRMANAHDFVDCPPHPELKKMLDKLYKPSAVQVSMLGNNQQQPSDQAPTTVDSSEDGLTVRELEKDSERVVEAIMEFCKEAAAEEDSSSKRKGAKEHLSLL